MYIDSYILGVILGGLIAGIIGFLSYLGIDLIRGHWTKKNILRGLIAEMEENKQSLKQSTSNLLSHEAWNEAKRTGVLMKLKEKTRNELLSFYSMLIYRNRLLQTRYSGHTIAIVPSNRNATKNGSGRINKVAELTETIERRIDPIIKLLKRNWKQ